MFTFVTFRREMFFKNYFFYQIFSAPSPLEEMRSPITARLPWTWKNHQVLIGSLSAKRGDPHYDCEVLSTKRQFVLRVKLKHWSHTSRQGNWTVKLQHNYFRVKLSLQLMQKHPIFWLQIKLHVVYLVTKKKNCAGEWKLIIYSQWKMVSSKRF